MKKHSAIRSVSLIVNISARKGEKLFFRALDILYENGIKINTAFPVKDPSRLPLIVQDAIKRKDDVIIIGGGDGTISSVIDYFVGKNAVLGILPFGTSNSFARTLHLPLDVEGAINTILDGNIEEINLGKVDNDYFANVISIGFPALIAKHTSHRLKTIFGPGAYCLIGIKEFFTAKRFTCTMKMNKKEHIVHTHHVLVANGSVYGVSPIVPQDELKENSLLVLTMDMVSRWKLLYFWMHFFLGRFTLLPEIDAFYAKEISITASPNQYIDVDGEITQKTPVQISLIPKAVRIIVGKNKKV